MALPSLEAYDGARVVVTGGLGFIGSQLSKRLVELDADVTIVDSLIQEYGGDPYNVREIADQVHINYSDIRDPWSLRYLVQDKDFIFNLAGQVSHIDPMDDPETDLDINCRSQLSLLQACRENNPDARVVFPASRQQYGRPQFVPVTEEHPLVPVDVNGINLVAVERSPSVRRGLRRPSRLAALTNTYGPHLLLKHDRRASSPPSSGSRSRVRRSGSSATGASYVTSPTSRMPSMRSGCGYNGRSLRPGVKRRRHRARLAARRRPPLSGTR
jgi:UDP-glucose 4-epimerase